jgi:hypothetical protein
MGKFINLLQQDRFHCKRHTLPSCTGAPLQIARSTYVLGPIYFAIACHHAMSMRSSALWDGVGSFPAFTSLLLYVLSCSIIEEEFDKVVLLKLS